MKASNFYRGIWYGKFLWKAFGWRGFLNRKNLGYLMEHFINMLQFTIADMVYRYLTKDMVDNTAIEEMREEFVNYHHKPQLNTWGQETAPNPSVKVPVNA